ncbi:MAG: hypothetical protein R2795_16455 [Saprospiraceae bacterium]
MNELTTPPVPPEGLSPRKRRRYWRWLWRILRWSGYVLLLMFLVLQLPPVQQELAQRAVVLLQDALGSKVTLKRLRVSWLDELNLVGLYVEDTRGDTMIASGNIIADFNLSPWAIYQRGIEVEALTLNGTQVHIRRAPTDSLSNIAYAIARLFPKKKGKTNPFLSICAN